MCMHVDSQRLQRLLGAPSSRRYRAVRSLLHSARALADLPERNYRRLTGRLATVQVGTSRMVVPEDMRWAFTGGVYYEHALARWLLRLVNISPGGTFYDVGANYGYYSLLLAPRVSHVHAFEPVTSTRTVLARNVASNGIPNVTIHDVGLSDSRGVAEIRLFSSSGNNSLFDVTPGERVRRLGSEVIALETLDSLVHDQGLPAPTLIKVDVEGAELFVIQGARRIIRDHLPTIVAEFHEPHFLKAGYRGDDLVTELTDAGYLVLGIPDPRHGDDLYPQSEFSKYGVGNIIAIDPSRVDGMSADLISDNWF